MKNWEKLSTWVLFCNMNHRQWKWIKYDWSVGLWWAYGIISLDQRPGADFGGACGPRPPFFLLSGAEISNSGAPPKFRCACCLSGCCRQWEENRERELSAVSTLLRLINPFLSPWLEKQKGDIAISQMSGVSVGVVVIGVGVGGVTNLVNAISQVP